MKYERLTISSKNIVQQFENIKLENRNEFCLKCFDRLAELEDKMENGTLIELPCKVGDTVYRITQSYRGNEKITIYTVKEIIIDKKGVTYLTIALKGASSITCKVNVDSVFLTREEAEAKLKELQE